MTESPMSLRGPTKAQLNAQLNRTLLSEGDFKEALQFLNCFQALDLSTTDVVVQRALLTAAVIAYCRPFSGNESHDMATGQPAIKLNTLFSAEQRELHDKLNILRNEAVAHSDYDRRPVSHTYGSLTGFAMWGANFDLLKEQLDIAKWEQMCERLIGECFQRAIAINREIEFLDNPSLRALFPAIFDGRSSRR